MFIPVEYININTDDYQKIVINTDQITQIDLHDNSIKLSNGDIYVLSSDSIVRLKDIVLSKTE